MLFEVALYLFLYMCLGFLLALYVQSNSVVDVLYGLGVLFTTLCAYAVSQSRTEDSFVLYVPLVLTSIWALRLSYRIFRKNYGKPEDARYAAWRTAWMQHSRLYFLVRTFLQIFMLQGVVIFCIAFPAMLVALYGAYGTMFNVDEFSTLLTLWLVYIGGALWVVGFFFETVGDYQLDRHIRTSALDPVKKGSIMTSGLWAHTRHPNYFGEICMWLGMAVLCAAQMPTLLTALACFISPALIAYLLIYVSGIPMLEKLMEKKEGWREYAAQTPALVPWVGWK
jgi:steroid 5-alpha reductase family enzyme